MFGQDLLGIVLGRYAGGRRSTPGPARRKHWFAMTERLVYPDGTEEPTGLWLPAVWLPNVLVDEGEASNINVYLREQANVAKWLGLVTVAAAPAETGTMTSVMGAAGTNPETKAISGGTVAVDGYARQDILAADWAAPALDAGDMQSAAAEQTFGPAATNAWAFEHAVLVTTQWVLTGLFIAYITTATKSLAVGVSYKATVKWKNQ